VEGTRERLQELPLFETFSPSDLDALIAQSRLETFAPQEPIIRFGQPGRFLCVILEGRVEVTVDDPDGGHERLNVLSAGEFVGEMSLLTGEPTNADVTAMQRCRVLVIPQEQFTAFLATNPTALQVMARVISQRLRQRLGDESAQARVEDAWQSTPDPYGLQLTTSVDRKILTLACAEGLLRFGYFDTAWPQNNQAGEIEGVGAPPDGQGDRPALTWRAAGAVQSKAVPAADHGQAMQALVAHLTDPEEGALRYWGELAAIGHKVAYGGETYGSMVVIDDEVMDHIERPPAFAAPLNQYSTAAIRTCAELAPQVLQVAVFDTAFHQTVPPQAYLYALPYRLYDEGYVRGYGFQGIAHHYVALQAAAYLQQSYRELKIITCYLDDNTSLCAIDHGRSVDTSMGLTPLGGLMTGTQPGDLDPAVLLHLLREEQWSLEEVEETLSRESGLKGLSGLSGDLSTLEEAASRGDRRAILAVHAFCYRIRKRLGAYISALDGVDAIVFTGRVGQSNAWVRSLACQGLSYMGIHVDELHNTAAGSLLGAAASVAVEISEANSRAKILVISTDEGRMIARETIRALGARSVDRSTQRQTKEIPIEVSARHVHLSQAHVEALFGPGHRLTVRAPLSQPGQYACEETVDLVGPRGRVDRVRILGPVRKETQVEIAMTEQFRLGLRAPIRASGDLEDSPGILLEGPAGAVELREGLICSVRHIHIPPEDALAMGLKDRDVCMVRVEGPRTLIFGDVLVRVSPDYRLAMHIDTDEGNAANIHTGMSGYLVSVQDQR
jgi:acetate kinase